ncbi:MAG: hypothetical protein IJW59_03050 [Clostridia bacterium]|nr:hypothetical protein [Clostridia bacterium]
MTDKQYNQLMQKVDKELQEYKDFMLTKDKKEIYEEFYAIHAHEDIHNFLENEGQKFDYKGFPKTEILSWLYRRFMKTEYELTCEDLGYFIEYETEDYKKQQKNQGME